MKKILSFVFTIVFVLGLSVLMPAKAAYAFDVRAGEQVSVAENESIDGSLFASGTSIDINGHINGDLYCLGQKVMVGAVVEGDVICGAQTLIINGDVLGNIRSVAQNLTVSGQVDRSVTTAGQDLTMSADSSVGQDVMFAGQTATLNGLFNRDVTGIGQTVAVNGSIKRNIAVDVNKLIMGPGAKVMGNLNYAAPAKGVFDPSATVAGKTSYRQSMDKKMPQKKDSEAIVGVMKKWNTTGKIVSLGFSILMGLVLLSLFPVFGKRVILMLESHPLRSVGFGLLTTCVMPFAVIAFLITIIGIPIGFLLGFAFAAIAYAGRITVGYVVGKRIIRQFKSKGDIARVWPLLVGLPLLFVLTNIPLIGWLIALGITLWGVGGIVLSFTKTK